MTKKPKLAVSDLRSKFLPLFRRSSTSSAASSTASSIDTGPALKKTRTRSKTSLATAKSTAPIAESIEEDIDNQSHQAPAVPLLGEDVIRSPRSTAPAATGDAQPPQLTFEGATPDSQTSPDAQEQRQRAVGAVVATSAPAKHEALAGAVTELPSHDQQYDEAIEDGTHASLSSTAVLDRTMVHRKIWVRRPGASATLVQINEEDLVDDVRDVILRKYSNSLGRSFDSPDVSLRIVARDHSHRQHAPNERMLGPEEHMTRTLDTYFPGGQSVEEALVIDVPHRRTPRHSPRGSLPYYAVSEDMRPAETDQDYFPVIPPGAMPSPHLASNVSAAGSTGSDRHHHSISVLNTGVVPPLPSPGSRSNRPGHRPRFGRNNTSSPTAVGFTLPHNGKPAHIRHGSASDRDKDMRLHLNAAPPAPPLATPPIANQAPAGTPPPRPASPRPKKRSAKRNAANGASSLPGPLLDGTVPPINVLIVEDNIINLKLLEAFMKRLKVRWHTAMNGRDAVKKWREGGFHLVLMDIQLPLMNGLDATKEIRRLESVNGVGVLGARGGADHDTPGNIQDKDKLKSVELFKSSVIIVALTASSLQSDRHEALAAGCNDFLTKPVNFVWLERKVTEWGCMQALIDFDGWRKWKEYAPKPASGAGPNAARQSSNDASTARQTEHAADNAANSADGTRAGAASNGNSAEQAAEPGTRSGSGSKTSSPTSARASDAASSKARKRNSFGRPGGLSGVAEELEDGRGVDVGA